MAADKSVRKGNPLFVMLFTTFVDLLGFGILIPVIPILLADPSSPFYILPAGMTVAQGYITLGFLTAIFPFMQFLATPILGQLSDHYGRRKLLALSLAGTSISYVIFALGIIWRNIPMLFLARALDGITGGNISIAQAAIADVTRPEDRAKNFGLLGAAFGVGFIVGPFLGGVLSNSHLVPWFNATTPFWFAAILSFINVCSVLLQFPETRARLTEGAVQWGQSIKNIVRAFGDKSLRFVFTTSFLFWSGFTFFTSFASVFLITRFGYTQAEIGNFFAYWGVLTALCQAFVTRAVSKRFSERTTLRITLLGASITLGILYLVTSQWVLYLLLIVQAPFLALTIANFPSIVSRSAGPESQGRTLGINTSIQTLAQSIPPALSGYIAARLSPTLPIAASSLFIFVAWIVFITLYKEPSAPSAVPENLPAH